MQKSIWFNSVENVYCYLPNRVPRPLFGGHAPPSRPCNGFHVCFCELAWKMSKNVARQSLGLSQTSGHDLNTSRHHQTIISKFDNKYQLHDKRKKPSHWQGKISTVRHFKRIAKAGAKEKVHGSGLRFLTPWTLLSRTGSRNPYILTETRGPFKNESRTTRIFRKWIKYASSAQQNMWTIDGLGTFTISSTNCSNGTGTTWQEAEALPSWPILRAVNLSISFNANDPEASRRCEVQF